MPATMHTTTADAIAIDGLDAAAYVIPTDAPESDGTLAWDSTTLVLVTAHAGGRTGIGYTYAGPAATTIIGGKLAGVVTGRDALAPTGTWAAMQHAVRNLGKPGLVATAISAVDVALWDLRARLRDEPLALSIAAVHESTPVYGSGGFTSYDNDQLAAQLSGWAELRVAALCDARGVDLSLHCAPQVSAHVGTAVWHLRHLEYFHDHVRIEAMAFDGVLSPDCGALRPDRTRPGLGLDVKWGDLEQWRVA